MIQERKRDNCKHEILWKERPRVLIKNVGLMFILHRDVFYFISCYCLYHYYYRDRRESSSIYLPREAIRLAEMKVRR